MTGDVELRAGGAAPPRSGRRRAVRVAFVVLVILVAVGYLLTPLTTSSKVACGGGGGSIAWEIGGPARQQREAEAERARMQQGLDGIQRDPAVATSPMGKEVLEDAQDAITSADAKQVAIDACSTAAQARIVRGALGAAAVIAAFFAAAAAVSWLRAVGRRRCDAREHRADEVVGPQHCPRCGALLDDPLGCWSCGAFVDGDGWRLPAQAPPDRARSITGSPPRGG